LLMKPSPRNGPQENRAEPTDAYESCLEQHNHEKDGNVVDPIEHDVSLWRLSAIIGHCHRLALHSTTCASAPGAHLRSMGRHRRKQGREIRNKTGWRADLHSGSGKSSWVRVP